MDNQPPRHAAYDPAALALKESMDRRLFRRSVVTGEIVLPAVPSMIDEYLTMCATLFASVGSEFTEEQLAGVRGVLEEQLTAAYAFSARSSIVISYDAPVGTTLNYHVAPQLSTVEQAYENWISTREPPLFGTEPDARVWALANEAADPGTCRILDIGAGTGRNALALARRGHPVDVVEMTPEFANMIREGAERESLDVRIIQRDVFATLDDLRQDYRLILLSEVVSDFRSIYHLRNVFQLATQCLAPGGCLVFNAFVAHDGFIPDAAVIELGQQMYTSIFTWTEICTAAAFLPLELVSDDSVYEYEQSHLPQGSWPPTSWYAEWVSGLDVFDVAREDSPVDMRWLVYRKVVAAPPTTRMVTLQIPGTDETPQD